MIFPYDILKEQKARIAALEAELAGYKESHEKYCPSAAKVRDLEAAIQWVITDALYKPPEAVDQIAQRWIDRLQRALTAPETKGEQG